MSWWLDCINTEGLNGESLIPISFGSQWPAKLCAKDPELIEMGW